MHDNSLVSEGDNLVGATLVVARTTLVVCPLGRATPAFAGTGRHKGVPYGR